jgi:hypothetical protein
MVPQVASGINGGCFTLIRMWRRHQSRVYAVYLLDDRLVSQHLDGVANQLADRILRLTD